MCGLVGSVGPKGSLAQVRLRMDRLRHRGPDGEGEACVSLRWGDVRVGVTRLAIVDLRPHPLPFRVGYDRAIVAFNGEIYNHRQLRAELSDGRPWGTDTDTEVVLRAWRRWGPEMLRFFNGPFALVVVDPARDVVFLARDRAGKKPLYYAVEGEVLHFASEAKALPIRLQEAPCPELELLEFDCGRSTPFQDVLALQPGEELLLSDRLPAHRPNPVRWWQLPAPEPASLTRDEAVEELTVLVQDAVRIRIPEEVPAGLLLSGGLDSAIIQAVARLDHLYTVSFPEEGLDPLPEARAAAQGREPVQVTFDRSAMEAALPDIAWHLDSPATWTAACQWFVAQQAQRDGVRVLLSGEGADELFGGYTRYRFLWWLDQAAQDPHCQGYDSHRRTIFGGERADILARMLDRSGGRLLQYALALAERYARGRSLVEDAARIEWHTTMQVLLRMADRMTAAFGMEARAPFLDYRIIEFATRLPVSLKITARESKAVLRDVARRLGVPRSIVDEPVKRGFTVPWNRWQQPEQGPRGEWDRSAFAEMMRTAWRGAFENPA